MEEGKFNRYITLIISVLCDVGFAIILVHGLLYANSFGWIFVYGVSLIAIGIPGIVFTANTWIEFNNVHKWLKLK